MSSADAVRVVMYAHDTYGLGHLTRTLRVARALREFDRRMSVLVLTGSPVAPYIALPRGADLVKLPSVVKTGSDRYRSRDLDVRFSQIRRMRAGLIRSTALAYRPHLFLVDNVPLGMKKEVLPTLQALRAELPETKIALILRDILDDPAVIRSSWEAAGVPGALEIFFDRLLVLGDRDLFDAIAAYGLPEGKSVHLGYAVPSSRQVPCSSSANGRRRVLVTAGGGGDGLEILSIALDGLCGISTNGHSMAVEVVTGPLMEPEERRIIARKALERGAEFQEFIPDLSRKMAEADLVISMAGYNTCCEILCRARAALLIPRVTPRVEQLLRAKVLESRGLVSVLEPANLTPEGMRRAVLDVLANGPLIGTVRLPALDGLPRAARDLESLLPESVRSRWRGPRRQIPASAPPSENGAAAPGETAPSSEPSALGHAAASRRAHVWFWPGAVRLLFLASLLGVTGVASIAHADSPITFGGSLRLGWDDNILQSSRAEERAFGTPDPDYWFAVDRLNDVRGEAGFWGRTEIPSFYKTLRITGEYQRSQVAHSPILGSDLYKLSLRQKLPARSRVDFMASLAPQVYLRHRADKDAAPGDPRFRPEAYRGTDVELSFTAPVRGIAVTCGVAREGRLESRWFRERDRRIWTGVISGAIGRQESWTLTPLYQYGVTRSRNRPDLGSDFASHEHAFGLAWKSALPVPARGWNVELNGRLKLRAYETSNPEDTSRYHRRDRTWWWNLYLRRPMGRYTPLAGVEAGGRRVTLPAGSTALDEDGEYDGRILFLGVEWQL